jgi:hypothetical protein
VRSAEGAQVPSAPAGPGPTREAVLAFIIAGVLTAQFVALRRRWRGQLSVRDPAATVTGAVGLPAVAVPPGADAGALAALLPAVSPPRVVTVVRRAKRPGAQTGSLLATLLSRRLDVLLVDGCPSRPSLGRELGVTTSPGLTDLPRPDAALRTALRETETVHGVRVLTAGDGGTGGAAQLLGRVVKADAAECLVIVGSWQRWEELAAVFGEVSGPVVLEVELKRATERSLRADVDGLRGLGADVVAVTVVGRA